MAFLDTTIVNIAFPSIVRTFGGNARLSTVSWVINGYNVVIAALLVPAGRAADRVGRRGSFVAGVAIFTVASAAAAGAQSAGVLIALRFIQAIGAAIMVPTSLALLLPRFGERSRVGAVTLWGAASALGAGIGPSLGGALVEAGSWRAVFLVNVPLGLFAAVAALRSMAEEREWGPLPDLLGAAVLTAAVGLLALGIVKSGEWHWTGAATLSCLVGSLALLAAVVRRSLRHPEPVVEPALLGGGTAAPGNVATLLVSVALYATILNNVLFLTGGWGISVLRAGLWISPAALLTALVARPAGHLAERFGVRRVVIPGALAYAGGVLVLAHAAGGTPSFVARWLPGSAIAGIGMGLALPPLIGVVVAGSPPARLATASGINAAVRQLGGVLGVALTVSVLAGAGETGGGPKALAAHRSAWYLAVDFALAAAVVAFGIRGRAGGVTVGVSEPGAGAERAPAGVPQGGRSGLGAGAAAGTMALAGLGVLVVRLARRRRGAFRS
ncbi:MAG: MFS transporter [Acidobacteriota bacterium]|nr:MFS transporter [Acidobacteriota bacterium]